jgi:hypothetical protein
MLAQDLDQFGPALRQKRPGKQLPKGSLEPPSLVCTLSSSNGLKVKGNGVWALP